MLFRRWTLPRNFAFLLPYFERSPPSDVTVRVNFRSGAARRGARVSDPRVGERSIPIVQEEAVVSKRPIDTEHVRVRTTVTDEAVVVRGSVSRQHVDVRRLAVEREVDRMPHIRDEDGVTIIPVVEERLVVEKRLFLVEEIHVSRLTTIEPVALPTTLRRTRVDIAREDLTTKQEDANGRT